MQSGELYGTAILRLGLIVGLAALVLLDRSSAVRWMVVVMSVVWALGYVDWTFAYRSLDTAFAAAFLLGAATLMASRPVSEWLRKRTAG